MELPRRLDTLYLFFLVLIVCSLLISCGAQESRNNEIIIGVTTDSYSLLVQPRQPDPFNTGIPSLDDLNRKWNIQHMTSLFPDVSPEDEEAARHGLLGVYKLVVKDGTNLEKMITDYEVDPNIEYAEFNQPFEIR